LSSANKGVLPLRMSTLLGVKNRSFRNLLCVRTNKGGERGVEPMRKFYGQGGGEAVFRDFTRTLLWTAPNQMDLSNEYAKIDTLRTFE